MVKDVPLTKGRFAKVDDQDYDFIMQFSWQARKSSRDSTHYAQMGVRTPTGRVTGAMARLILQLKLGRPIQDGFECDHINRDGLDNRRENLREVSHAETCRNRSTYGNNRSGVPGIGRRGNRWRAYGYRDGKRVHLGYFDTIELAKAALQEDNDDQHS